jgi:DNA polymerase IV
VAFAGRLGCGRPRRPISSVAKPALCRDCLSVEAGPQRCTQCGSPRVLRHPELFDLSIAHLDCDAFYASVEKRDDPSLRDKPLIIGGTGRRGVVSTACYIARISGVHSAMPMYLARKACPDAVVMMPNMDKYTEVAAGIRALMKEVTPLVEPLSLDEAFLDLTGTSRLHHRTPVETMANLVRRIKSELGVNASVGLSYNKFLAKVASDLDKPRGFSVIGRAEAKTFLAAQPVKLLWGVGKAMQKRLARDGYLEIAQLQGVPPEDLMRRYGSIGQRIAQFVHGNDTRQVNPNSKAKSVSAETTFTEDIRNPEHLSATLWRLCEKVSRRLKAKDQAGATVVLKLRTADFRIRTRNRRLPNPTQLADVLYQHGSALLTDEADGTAFRLLGIGVSGIGSATDADPPDLADPDAATRARAEHAVDTLREKFGTASIGKGRRLGPKGTL